MGTAGASKADAGRVDVAKTARKVATAENQLSKETMVPGLRKSLLVTMVDGLVIAKLEEG